MSFRAWQNITAWQIEGAKGEGVTDSFFLGSKTTADSAAATRSGDDCFLAVC